MTLEKNMPADAPQTGVYKHYKGNLYQVFGMTRHSETDEWMVLYQALYGEYGFWVRPLSIWLEPLKIDSSGQAANATQRFELVTPTSDSLMQLTKQTSN